MVRINLIPPKLLTDQHLCAEQVEILMLLSTIPKLKGKIPENFCLGKGHITFFADKVLYLHERHKLIRKEMLARGFNTIKTTDEYLAKINSKCFNNFTPSEVDYNIIVSRLLSKIEMKPNWYKYYGQTKSVKFYQSLYK